MFDVTRYEREVLFPAGTPYYYDEWAAGSPKRKSIPEPDEITERGACWRYWLFILYANQLVDGWQDRIAAEWRGGAIISPLHDLDVLTDEDGSQRPKPAHYHVILESYEAISFADVRRIMREITGSRYVRDPEPLMSVEAQMMYWTHLTRAAKRDRKHVYDPEEIQMINMESTVYDHIQPQFFTEYAACKAACCGTWWEYQRSNYFED